MKKISRKLLVSSLSLAFATVALGTTTFAWFTTNAQVTADITVGVQATGDSILISKDAFSWGSSVEFDESDVAMSPVTYNAAAATLSAADDTFKKLDDSAAVGGQSATSNYLQFTVYLKVSNASKAIKFDNIANEATTTAASRKRYNILKTTDFKYADNTASTLAAGTKIKADAVNALRSVVDVSQEGSAATQAYQDAVENNAAAAAFGNAAITYTRRNMVAQFTGEGEQQTSYSLDDTINFGQTLAGTNAANAYIEQVLGTNFSDDQAADYKAANAHYAAATHVEGWASQATGDPVFTTSAAEAIYALRFSYWLEGYDADCFDIIMAQVINLKLGFKAE